MADHRRQIRRLARRRLLSAVALLAVLASLASICFRAVTGYLDPTALPTDFASRASAAVMLFALVGTLGWAGKIAVDVIRERPRIVPHFERHLNSPTETLAAFQRGFGLAADLDALDRLSSQMGTPPLSSLGFADDQSRQPVTWFNADVGLQCVAALRARIAEFGAGLSEDTAYDLEALGRVLERAAERRTRFSLLIRVGSEKYINPVEMDRRTGTFF